MSFDDHYEYTKEDIKNLEALAKKRAAKCLVTTEKDAVKIAELTEDLSLPVFALKLKTDVDVEHILSELNFNVSPELKSNLNSNSNSELNFGEQNEA